MKKKLFLSTFILIFAPALIFCLDGILWGEKDIRISSTKWFDLIYPKRSESTAKVLYESADGIYEEICSGLGTAPQFRMTVTISPATDNFNASFSNFSSNHITILDTVPNDSLAVFSDIKGTFRHELTHAVTNNMRTPFWKALDGIFGDIYNFGYFVTMTSFIKEGASVAEESKGGEGRLNDGYFLHMVRQSVLQGSFPSYTSVTGAKDTYPAGSLAYGFSAPFTEWLQEKYGMEKYALFWYTGINMKSLTYEGAFKKTYGISMKTAWEDFRSSVKVPSIPADPSENPGSGYYKYGKSSGAVYDSLTAGKKGVAWIEKKSSSVYFAEWENGEAGRAKKMFSLKNISSIKISASGDYIAAGRISINHGNTRNEIFIYDMKNGSLTKVPELSLRDGSIIEKDGGLYLLAVKTECQKSSLSLWKINLKKGRISSFDFVRRHDFPEYQIILSPVDAGNGKTAFIKKDGKAWSICVMDMIETSSPVIKEVRMDDGISLRNLSAGFQDGKDCARLLFSWASKDVFPRLGLLDFGQDEAAVSLMNSDISGGVYNPVICCGEKSFMHTGNFISENRLIVTQKESVSFKEIKKPVIEEKTDFTSDGKIPEKTEEPEIPSKKFHGGFLKGDILPFCSIPVFNMFAEEESRIYFPGVSYMCTDAWNGSQLEVMAGINPGAVPFSYIQGENFEAALGAKISGGTSTQLFKYSVLLQTAFDASGYMQTGLNTEISSALTFGRSGFFIAQNNADIFFGRDYTYSKNERFLTFSDKLIFQIGSSISTGPGMYQSLAFIAQGTADFISVNSIEGGFHNALGYIYAFPSILVRIPNLIPVDCHDGFTYNLPLRLCLSYAPSPNEILGGYAKILLFDFEIQNGPPYVPVYFNRIVSVLTYTGIILSHDGGINPLNAAEKLFSWSGLKYTDSLKLTAVLQCTPNTGAMANPQVMATIGASFCYYPHHEPGADPFSVSLATSLNF